MALQRRRAGPGTTVPVALLLTDAELAAGELEGGAARLRLQRRLREEQIRGQTILFLKGKAVKQRQQEAAYPLIGSGITLMGTFLRVACK